MGGMPYGLAGPTRQMTLGHEPASEIGAAGADVTCPRVDDPVATTQSAASSWIDDRRGAYGGVADDGLVDNAGRSARSMSHRFATTEVHDAVQLALSPGAAAKAVVTFGD